MPDSSHVVGLVLFKPDRGQFGILSISIEDLLNLFGIVCNGQSQLEKDSCFLWVKRITFKITVISPLLNALGCHAIADSRRTDDDNAFLYSFGQAFVSTVGD